MCNQKFLNFVIWTICYFILLVVTTGNGDGLTNQTTKSEKFSDGDSREFKLTKLLNIEIGGQPEKHMDADLHSTILSEIKKGIRGELGNSAEPSGPTHVPLENYSHKDMVTILKELYSEVSALKKNITDAANYPLSECFIQSDILNGKSYPVGTSSHKLCHENALNKEDTGSKKYFPRSCKEIQEQGSNKSGVYQIQPKKSTKPFMVLCDMETKGGGWTHIQKRYDGSVDFYLGWREYKFGFGDLGSEFWIGLENIYKMTGIEVNELLVELVDRENKVAHAHYQVFGLGSESEGYPLSSLKGYSGDAGDSLAYHVGYKFTTKDFDQDNATFNCAEGASGAWWYKDCFGCNLNGKFINVELPEQYKYKGLQWTGFRPLEYCLAKSRMMIRPVGST